MAAFVTFYSIRDANTVLRHFNNISGKKYRKDTLFYLKKPIFRNTTDPGDIIWENYGIEARFCSGRRFLVILALLLWTFLGLAAVRSSSLLIQNAYFNFYYESQCDAYNNMFGDNGAYKDWAFSDKSSGKYSMIGVY